MSRVVFVSPAYDLAGAGYALKEAFDVASDWEARAICRSESYLRYRTDIVWRPFAHNRAVRGIVEGADVVHAMNQPRGLTMFRRQRGQRFVVHHLGTAYRRDPERMSARCRSLGAVEVTDSIDLLYEGVKWLPIPADLDRLAVLRESRYTPSSVVRIAHAPTNRYNKDTDAIVAAVKSLARKYPIEFDLVERVRNSACLYRKARADIFVDQLKYGFGVNAIECWGMGIPVVSGLTESEEGKRRGVEMWGSLPWADADPTTLEDVLENLIVDEQARKRLGDHGRTHAHEWHSQAAVVGMATAIYDAADTMAA